MRGRCPALAAGETATLAEARLSGSRSYPSPFLGARNDSQVCSTWDREGPLGAASWPLACCICSVLFCRRNGRHTSCAVHRRATPHGQCRQQLRICRRRRRRRGLPQEGARPAEVLHSVQTVQTDAAPRACAGWSGCCRQPRQRCTTALRVPTQNQSDGPLRPGQIRMPAPSIFAGTTRVVNGCRAVHHRASINLTL